MFNHRLGSGQRKLLFQINTVHHATSIQQPLRVIKKHNYHRTDTKAKCTYHKVPLQASRNTRNAPLSIMQTLG